MSEKVRSLTPMELAAEQQRARIVAYLRNKADSLEATAATLRAQGNMIEWAGASSAAVTTRMNADAIERNQHGQ